MNNNFNNNGGYQYDNPFTREPQYDFYDELVVKDARKATSRSMLSLVLYVALGTILTYAIIYGVFFLFAKFLGNEELFARINGSVYYQKLVSTLPMYAIGIPAVIVTLKSVPKKQLPLEKPKMRFVEWLMMIPIAEVAMIVGGYIGSFISEVYSLALGIENKDAVADLIDQVPPILLFVLTVILAPVFEELIFRKLLLDRLSVYGNKFAIIVTAVAFGLFHGNLDQLFYATLGGLVLGYVAVKSGNWLYSVGLHMVMNFIGGMIPALMSDSIAKYTELSEMVLKDPMAFASLSTGDMLIFYFVSICSSLIYALIIGGVVLLVLGIRKRWFVVDERLTVKIPRKRVAGVIFKNVGVILFLVMSGIFIMLDLYMPLIQEYVSQITSGGTGV